MFVKMSVSDAAGPQIQARIVGLKTADQQTKALASEFAKTVAVNAPKDTGWLVQTATLVGSSGGGKIGYNVGPFSKLGNPGSKAPKGTIRQFLEDYPQYGRGMGKTKSGKQRVRRRRRAFPSAWHFLSSEAKRKLRDLRRSGMYGMDGPSPRYWQAIQENRVPGQGGQMGGVDYLTDAYLAAYAMSRVLEKTVFGR